MKGLVEQDSYMQGGNHVDEKKTFSDSAGRRRACFFISNKTEVNKLIETN